MAELEPGGHFEASCGVAKFLIVDAHSMIFAWPEMRALHARRMVLARDALVRTLTEYQDLSGLRVVAVFDGQGERVSETSEPGGIQIFYSGRGQTADSVIERLVAKYATLHEITVATGDRLEAQTAESFGGACLSAEALWRAIEQARGDFQRELRRRRAR